MKLDCFGGLLKYNIIVIGFVLRKHLKITSFRQVVKVGLFVFRSEEVKSLCLGTL